MWFWRRSPWRSGNKTPKKFVEESVEVPCRNDTDLEVFLNREDVREALHIPGNLPEFKAYR